MFFWHFFEDIEKELSYERWIDKYKLFLTTLLSSHISYQEDFQSFKQFCKILYLQNHADEARFEQLLDKAILKEKELLIKMLTTGEAAADAKKEAAKPPKNDANTQTKSTGADKPDKLQDLSKPDKDKGSEEEEFETRYFHPRLDHQMDEAVSAKEERREQYLHTDEYFPLTRRRMVKAWQYLRREEKQGYTTEVDLPATVKQICKDGMFLNPVYKHGYANRQDTLIVFADSRGSMTPFQEMTERFISTARTEGGHERAPVYYYQNSPSGYVFRNANLSGPIKLKEALVRVNRNSTVAVIISDAGAARGNTDPEAIRTRVAAIRRFLDQVKEYTAQIIWLNPMPAHRWKGNAAEIIAKEVTLMSPIFDKGEYPFQETIRLIMRKQRPKS